MELNFPTKSDFEVLLVEDLHLLWRKNHDILLHYIKTENIPYFGLHGTNIKNLTAIKNSGGGHFELATFYDKKKTEKRLYQLYNMCRYVLGYAIKGGMGCVLVFYLEEDNKNVSSPWENLKPFSINPCFNFDNLKERRFFSMLNKEKNLLWRTEINLFREHFTHSYCGEILFEKMADRYFSEIDCPVYDSLSKEVMRTRFLAQEILYEALNLIRAKK